MSHHHVLLLTRTNVPQRIQGINRLAGECGWTVRYESVGSPPTDWHGDGVLVMMDGSPNLVRFISRLRRQGIPVVDLVEECPRMTLPRVTGDDLEIGRVAAQSFNALGFRHAAFFSAWPRTPSHTLRSTGFRSAWRGDSFASWLFTPSDEAQDSEAELDAWLDERLSAAPKPLALFAWHDRDATHILRACQRIRLRVPQDVALIGVDNDLSICEHQSVKLSSVAHNLQRIGYTGAAMLERLMSGGKLNESRVAIKPLGLIARDSTNPIALVAPDLQPILRHIAANLDRPLGAAQIAEDLHLSRLRLDRLFRAKLGRSVGAEIARQRLERAQKLLRETSLPLAAIAAQCGHCDAGFLIRTFKKAFGLTPNQWRQQVVG